jgi:hypothetical protein
MKLNSALIVLLFIAFAATAQDERSYFVNRSNDTVEIEQGSWQIYGEGFYYKRKGSKKREYVTTDELRSKYVEGHLMSFVPNSEDGKGLWIWSDIIAVNDKYIFALAPNFSDICDAFIIDKKTYTWVEPRIKTESGKKREAAKQMVLKYFGNCAELVEEINKTKRFPSYELRSRKLFQCD